MPYRYLVVGFFAVILDDGCNIGLIKDAFLVNRLEESGDSRPRFTP
jgi:hypothetical protein